MEEKYIARKFTVGEYESGFYVETAHPSDVEKLVTVAGPFSSRYAAQQKADELEPHATDGAPCWCNPTVEDYRPLTVSSIRALQS